MDRPPSSTGTCHFDPSWNPPIREYIYCLGLSTVYEVTLLEGSQAPYLITMRPASSQLWFVGLGWLKQRSEKYYALACAEILNGTCRVHVFQNQHGSL